MSHLEVPRFPRGFLLSDRPVDAPAGFVPGPLLKNFWVHPWANIEVAGDQDLFVVIVGHCVPTSPNQGLDAAGALLAALQQGEGAFFAALNNYGGRHAVVFGSAGNISVVNDATGMRSVFYATDGGVVASHALLVELALGGQIEQTGLVFAYGYPGNRTPYTRTIILTPNTYYWMTAHVVRRVWPVTTPTPGTVDQVAHEALQAAATALQNIGRMMPVRMALTAGLDSRVILAVGLYSGVAFGTYTYGTNKATALDRAFAPDLATHAGVSHTLVPSCERTSQLQASLREVSYSSHHAGAVPGLMAHYSDPHTVAVTGNLLEIGRSFYDPHRQSGAMAPVDAVSMSDLHFRSMTPASKRLVDEYGVDRFRDASIEAFEGFITDTGYSLTAGLLDPFDQFYWEHRMGTWHGPALAERDFYGVAFIPFNVRQVFESMLSVPQHDRDTSAVFYRMIEMVDPALLELPVNPKHWPPK